MILVLSDYGQLILTRAGQEWQEMTLLALNRGALKWALSIILNYFSLPLYIPIISLIIGFYLGLKSLCGKYKFLLFVFPPLFSIIGVGTVMLLSGGGGGDAGFFWFFFLIALSVGLSILSLIMSLIIYFKKERLFYLATVILFLFFISGLIGFGKYAELKRLENKRHIETIEKSVLEPLLEKAITNKFPALCEELKNEVQKVEYYWLWYLDEKYYNPCIREVAMRIGDETLCRRMRYVESQWNCEDKISSMKEFIQKNNECKGYGKFEEKIQCIKEIALRTNNAELCAEIYDVDCVEEIAIGLRNPKLCDTLKEIENPPLTTVHRKECYGDPRITKLIEQIKEEKKTELPDLIIKDFYYDEPHLYTEYCNLGGSDWNEGNLLIKTESIAAGVGNYLEVAYPDYPSRPEPEECKKISGFSVELIKIKTAEKKDIIQIIDWENKIKELNEENNIKTKTIEIENNLKYEFR